MESLSTTPSILFGKLYTEFATTNLLDSADKMDRDATIYDVAAKALAVIGLIFVVAAVAGATIGALTLSGGIIPIAAVVGGATLLIASAIFHKYFVEGLIPMEGSEHKLGIRYLKARSLEMKQDAEREREIQTISTGVQDKFSSPQVAQVFARFSYWNDVAKKKGEKVQELQGEIDKVKERIQEAETQRKDTSEDLKELSSLLRKKFHFESEELAPAKVTAAYMRHIFFHPEEDRALTEILSPQPSNYADYQVASSAGHQSPIFQKQGVDMGMIYLSDIQNQTISQLAEQLFAQQEILV